MFTKSSLQAIHNDINKALQAVAVAHMIVNKLFAEGKFKLAPGKKKWMPHGSEWKEIMAVLKVPASVTHSYDCLSIEKNKKISTKIKTDRVTRIMKQIMRLTEAEFSDLSGKLEAIS